MNRRQESAERTRRELIDAGFRLAERTGLTDMSINDLVREAGVSKGTFFHHFGDRTSYMVELHRTFHDGILTDVAPAIASLAPGRERLLSRSLSYLDACLRNRGVRALLLEARADSAITSEVVARNEQIARLCREDFAAMGWAHPLESGRLWVGLVAEAALVELDAGRRSNATRAALGQYLTGRPSPPAAVKRRLANSVRT
jgi:TetR/AcrR family transcriptional regulator, transcriptional repressor for nem operon